MGKIALRHLKHYIIKPAALMGAFILLSLFASSLQAQSAPHKDWKDLEHRKEKVYGSEKEIKYPVSLWPIIEIENWEKHKSWEVLVLFKGVNYPGFRYNRIGPWVRLRSKKDNRYKQFLFPFYYWKVDGPERFLVHPLGFWNKTENRSTTFFVPYLRRHDSRTNETQHSFLPFVYTGTNRTTNGRYFTFLPFFYLNYENNEHRKKSKFISPLYISHSNKNKKVADQKDKYSYSLLHHYSREQNKYQDQVRLGFPVLPFFFSYRRDKNYKRWNLLTVFHAGFKSGHMERLWFAPFFFYNQPNYTGRKYARKERSFYAPLLLTFYKKTVRETPSGKNKAQSLFFPGYYSEKRQSTGKYEQKKSLTISLPYYYKYKKRKDKPASYTFAAPLLPFIIHTGKNSESYHMSLLTLFYYETEQNRFKKFFAIPFFFYNNGEAVKHEGKNIGYTGRSVLTPLVYYSSDYAKNDARIYKKKKFISPLLYHNSTMEKTPDDLKQETFNISLLHFYSSKKDRKKPSRYSFGLPVIPFLAYVHKNKDAGDLHLNFLSVMFDYQREDNRFKSLMATPLFFYKNGDEATENGKTVGYKDRWWLAGGLFYYSSSNVRYTQNAYTKQRFVSPLFFHNAGKTETDKGTREKIFNMSFLHFYFREKKPEGENRFNLGFPIIPVITFIDSGPDDFHLNFLTIFDIKRKKGNVERFWAAPIFFYGKNYTHVAPLFWSWSNPELKEKFSAFLPFYFSAKSPNERFLITPLSYFRRKKSKADETQQFYRKLHTIWWYQKTLEKDNKLIDKTIYVSLLPIYIPNLPLYFSKQDDTGIHRNVLGLVDWRHTPDGSLKRFWAAPFVFYKKNAYTHVLPPFFWSFRNKTSETHFSPFFYFRKKTASTSKLLAGPVWLSSDSKAKTKKFHLLPLYYSWRSPVEKGHSFLPAYWYRKNTQTGKRLLTAAFVYNSRETKQVSYKSYNSWIPLFWHYSRRITQNDDTRSTRKKSASIFHYSYSKTKSDKEQNSFRTLHWFPIIPLAYIHNRWSNKDSQYTTPILFTHLTVTKEKKIKRWWTLPFVFYKRNTYLHVLPFYIRPYGFKDPSGWAAGALHYHRWGQNRNIFWLGPYYSSDNKLNSKSLTLLLPVYYRWNTPASRGRLIIPWHFEMRDTQKYISIYFLGGASTTKRTGPVRLGTGRGKNGKWYLDSEFSVLYDLFSVATRISLPGPGGETTNDKKLIKDIDIKDKKDREPKKKIADKKSSDDRENKEIGKKLTPPNLDFFEGKDEKKIAQEQERELKKRNKPSLSFKETIRKENSEYFWGMKLLFGAFAYERADTRRHVRVLPFGWLSWDVKSNDKVTVWPFFVNYQSKDLGYFAVIPFYGKQRQGKSYLASYGTIMFLRQYDDKTKEKEFNAVWPFTSLYYGPKRYGFRVLPFVWHRTDTLPGLKRHRTLTPLFYHKTEEKIDGKKRDFSRYHINPLAYVDTNSNPRGGHKKIFLPFVVPAFGYWSNTTTEHSYIPHFQRDEKNQETAIDFYELRSVYRNKGWSYLFPFYLTFHEDSTNKDESGALRSRENSRSLIGLPFLYYSKRIKAEGTAQEEKVTTDFFLLGFYRHNSPHLHSHNFLMGLYSYKYDKTTEDANFKFFYGLLKTTGTARERTGWFLPFLYYNNKRNKDSQKTTVISLLYNSKQTNRIIEKTKADGTKKKVHESSGSSFFTIPLLYHNWDKDSNHYNMAGFFDWRRENTPEFKQYRWWLFPFALYNSSEKTKKKKLLEFYSPLVIYKKADYTSPSGAGYSDKSLWIFPVFYRSESPYNTHYNVGLLFDWKQQKQADKLRWYFLPFAYYKNNYGGHKTYKTQDFTFLNPLFFYFKHNARDTGSPEPSKHTLIRERGYVVPLALMYIGLERQSNPGNPDQYKYKYTRFNWMLFIDVRSWKEKKENTLRWMTFPFAYYKSTAREKATSNFNRVRFYTPLWFYNKRHTNDLNAQSGSYYRERSVFLPFPLLYLNKERGGSQSKAGPQTSGYTRVNLMGFLFDYKYRARQNTSHTSWHLFPFAYYRGETQDGNTAYRMLTPLSYWKSSGGDNPELTRWVWPFVFYKNGPEGYVAVLPFYYKKRDRSKGSLTQHFLPPFYMSWEKPGQRKLFIAGLYLNDSKNYRRQNFLFLYDHQSLLEAKIEKYSMLFGSVHMENGPQNTKFYLMYRLLFGVNYTSPRDHNFNVLWWYNSKRGNRSLSHFMPFYYYETNKARSVFFSPLLLSYARRDTNGVFQLVGAGLIWYRNYDSLTGKDDKLLLGGLLYQEKHRRLRGYSSYGSAWGFAWKYQKEKETGWKKFTLLSLIPVYKRVIHNGKEYKYIMGIRGKGSKR